jgi:hypothetical protein
MHHPNETVPADLLPAAYADLLATLARDEPDALRRAAATVQEEVGDWEESTARLLARAWLAFAGNAEQITSPHADVFHFTFPAHIAFEVVVLAGGVAVAKRVARRALAKLDASDNPLGGVEGPLPGAPSLLNVTVWAGSKRRKDDHLELELTDLRRHHRAGS